MAREVSSISRIGTSEPFELQVSRGQIAYHKQLFKFGNNPTVGDSLPYGQKVAFIVTCLRQLF